MYSISKSRWRSRHFRSKSKNNLVVSEASNKGLVVTIIGIFMAILFILNYIFRQSVLSSSGSANAHLSDLFPPLDIPFEYWIEYVTFGLFH